MKIIDRIALNRTFIIIGNFIMSLINLFTKKTNEDKQNKPDKTVRFPWLRNVINRNKK